MDQIGRTESGPLSQLSVDEDVSAVEAIGQNVLTAHSTILGALVVVLALEAFYFFLFIGRRHSRDGNFKRQDRFHRAGKGDLDRATHLTGIDSGAHDRAKGANIEEVVAHELS